MIWFGGLKEGRYLMRRVCGYVGLHPRTYRYQPIRPQDWLASKDVLEVGKEAGRERDAPDHLGSDNGSEFIARIVRNGFRKRSIKTISIAPGTPGRKGCIESFHAF